MKYAILIFLFFAAIQVPAQNLVPNPSFEDANQCPLGISNLIALANWFSPTSTTPDYYNPCNNNNSGTVGVPKNAEGYQQPHTGTAYAGFLCPQWKAVGGDAFIWSEYLSVKLNQSLIGGHKYYVSFYVNHADAPDYVAAQYNVVGTDRIGAVLTSAAIDSAGGSLSMQPDIANPSGSFITDTVNWTKIQGFYTAVGGEQYITLGYFHSADVKGDPISYQMIKQYDLGVDNQAYYYVDDVCVTDLNNAVISSRDTILDCSQELTLQGHIEGTTYTWSTGDTTANIQIDTAGTYWVGTLEECIYYVDTFHVRFQPRVDSGGVLVPCKDQQNGKAWVVPSPGETNTFTYSWENDTDNIVHVHTGNSGDTLLGAGAGAYQVYISNGNGCNDTISITIPAALYQASFITDSVVCQQREVSFQNTSTGNLIAWHWQFGDGDTSLQLNPTHIYTQPGTYHIILAAASPTPCYDTADATIIVDSGFFATFTTDKKAVCEGSEISFYPSAPTTVNNLLWNFGDGTSIVAWQPTHAYNMTGQMIATITVQSKNCPDSSFSDTLQVYPYPVVDIGPDTTMCPGQQPVLVTDLAPYEKSNTYVWSTEGATENAILITTPGTYWLQATSAHGCITTDSVTIKPDCYVGIPNAFTPNGDGVNDYFFPRQLLANGIIAFHMQVFNRWGQQLFETRAVDGRGWDGRLNNELQPEGVYVYLIEVNYINGSSEKYQGNVTLLK